MNKAGQKFTPRQLLEGYSEEETYTAMMASVDLMDQLLGSDEEAKVVIYSYLMGRSLSHSRIEPDMAFGMVLSALHANQGAKE